MLQSWLAQQQPQDRAIDSMQLGSLLSIHFTYYMWFLYSESPRGDFSLPHDKFEKVSKSCKPFLVSSAYLLVITQTKSSNSDALISHALCLFLFCISYFMWLMFPETILSFYFLFTGWKCIFPSVLSHIASISWACSQILPRG